MSAFPQTWKSTVSHWQATNRGPDALWSHGSSDPLPVDVVDFVIVGAGMTGSSLAYHLTRSGAAGDGKTVVCLEAKDVASGASGRNGGHIAPASFATFPSLIAPLSAGGAGLTDSEALAVLANELDTLDYAQQLIEDEKLAVDFWRGYKLEVKVSQQGAEANRQAYRLYAEAHEKSVNSHTTAVWKLLDDPEIAQKLSRVPSALAVNRGPAGSCHPHKLATALMKLALASASSKFTFHSWCPVKSISRDDAEANWVLDCHGRGLVRAKVVILCTNAHTRHLFPAEDQAGGIARHIKPFRGHASLITPTPNYSGKGTIEHSYSLEAGPYFMTTPSCGIVSGVYNATALSVGLAKKGDIYGVIDDSVVLPCFKTWLSEYCERTFDGWGEEAHGEGLTRVWTGIMAASRDNLPLIGSVPGKEGLYAAVAFHGHGMARILTCTRALALQLLRGPSSWDERLPTSFKITEERLERARRESPEIITAEEMRGDKPGLAKATQQPSLNGRPEGPHRTPHSLGVL